MRIPHRRRGMLHEVLCRCDSHRNRGGADRGTRTGLRGPAATVDDVVAIMAELTDPDIPAANKGNIVTPGFSPDEAGTIDDHLNRMRHRSLPFPFVASDIQPVAMAGAAAQIVISQDR
jgi:hypothetical protein